jgi:hypothetical protein
MDMMRIPLATVLFVGSVGLLYTLWKPDQVEFLAGLDNVTSGIIAVACIVCLVYSFILYSNLNVAK